MLKTKKCGLFFVAVIVVASVFVYYRYAKDVLQVGKQEEVAQPKAVATSKEVSAVVTYATPGDEPDTLRFVVTLDQTGLIQNIQTLDATTNEVPAKKKEFNDQINVILKGKKLSELTAIDKVGKSSLTTTAFNSALGDLQKAL